jgi:hypothetical protein
VLRFAGAGTAKAYKLQLHVEGTPFTGVTATLLRVGNTSEAWSVPVGSDGLAGPFLMTPPGDPRTTANTPGYTVHQDVSGQQFTLVVKTTATTLPCGAFHAE